MAALGGEANVSNSDSTENPMMPVWLDDSHLDPAWLRRHTGLECAHCTARDISNETRRAEKPRDGTTLQLQLEFQKGGPAAAAADDDAVVSLIVKQTPPGRQALSQQLGLAREALFYNELAADIVKIKQQTTKKKKKPDGSQTTTAAFQNIPKILYAYGNVSSGEQVIVMEDLSHAAVDSGVFFGPGNPNNWNRDLPAMVARAVTDNTNGPPSAAHVARSTFLELAQVHAAFWRRPDLLQDQYSFLRGHAWLQGKGEESWRASQSLVQQFWKVCVDREATDKPSCLKWDTTVRAAVETSVQGISWEAQLKRLNTKGRWTVVHGDCWPGNFMWMIRNSSNDDDDEEEDCIKLLDWEMVGVGSGPQDLGQYVLSNMDPHIRRECEHDLIRAYYDELLRCGVTDVDWEYCWKEYKLGGIERWLWFLIYFVGQEDKTMLAWAQFFHDQIASFMHDHSITALDITQPRP